MSVRPSVGPSVRPSVRRSVPCYFRMTNMANFESKKSTNDIINNDKISDDEVVASYVPPRYLFFVFFLSFFFSNSSSFSCYFFRRLYCYQKVTIFVESYDVITVRNCLFNFQSVISEMILLKHRIRWETSQKGF